VSTALSHETLQLPLRDVLKVGEASNFILPLWQGKLLVSRVSLGSKMGWIHIIFFERYNSSDLG